MFEKSALKRDLSHKDNFHLLMSFKDRFMAWSN